MNEQLPSDLTPVASALSAIDSFPYRHRLREVMSTPVVLVSPSMSLGHAIRRMDREDLSAFFVEDQPGRAVGIVTERDILRAISRSGNSVLDQPVSQVMSSPVASLPPDVFLFRAVARMDRLRVRHLLVMDWDGRALGMISSRDLLRHRARRALLIGDQAAEAKDSGDLAKVRGMLPDLAGELIAEDTPPITVAAVIAQVMRDITSRAAELAELELGSAPAPWCLMALGAAGRGECFLDSAQAHAMIHLGGPSDSDWFERFGQRIVDRLAAAGIPAGRSDKTCASPEWRCSANEWRQRVDEWCAAAEKKVVRGLSVFGALGGLVDVAPVAGQAELARSLRAYAIGQINKVEPIVAHLAKFSLRQPAPLDWLGRVRLTFGRIDLEAELIGRVAAAVRALALVYRVDEAGTIERIRALARKGVLAQMEAQELQASVILGTGLILHQQVIDTRLNIPASTRVDHPHLPVRIRKRVKAALRVSASLESLVLRRCVPRN